MTWLFFVACGDPASPSMEDLQADLLAAEQTIEALQSQLAQQERRMENVSRLDEAMEAAHTFVEARCSGPEGTPTEQTQRYAMSEQAWNELVGEPEVVLTQGRWIPHGSAAEPTGWRMVRLTRGGLFDTCGLRSADVLVSINNVSIIESGGPKEALGLVVEEGEARLEILRARKPLSLVIERVSP